MAEALAQNEDCPEKETEMSLKDRLKSFSYYLVENFELNLKLCLHLLENRQLPKKDNGIYIQLLGTLAAGIPTVGRGLGSALKEGEVYILNKIDKTNSRTLADLVYYYSDHKEQIREILIEASVEIFCCFESQFGGVTCNGGPKRAMQKLAQDASHRIFTHFLQTNQTKNISKEDITKGVVLGESKSNKYNTKQGRIVSFGEIVWNTSKLFRKVGWVDEVKFYKTQYTNTEKYGHRRLFSWEKLEEIWEEDKQEFPLPKFVITPTNELLLELQQYIMGKSSDELAKLQRDNHHTLSMEDRETKQKQLIDTIDANFEELFNTLQLHYTSLATNENQSEQILDTIDRKHNEEVQHHDEIKLKLTEIHHDVKETKDGQVMLLQCSETIKTEMNDIRRNQQQMEQTAVMINVEKVKELVDSQTKEHIERAVKEQSIERKIDKVLKDVRETLRKNDPGKAIKKLKLKKIF